MSSVHQKKPLVSIALATYNGEAFLAEFLVSINAQCWTDLEIVVSDDCSTDRTREILQGYRGVVPLKIVGASQRLGIVGNFERAMSACSGDYIALADQDDVWDRGKITGLVTQLQHAEAAHGAGVPLLAFSNVELVDEKLQHLSPSFFKVTGKSTRVARLRDFLLSNHIPGCSMLFNRATLTLALPIPTQFAMHDWWISMVVAAYGKIIYVDRPYVRYRQHSGNAVGAGVVPNKPATTAITPHSVKARRDRKLAQAVQVLTNLQCFGVRFDGKLPPDACHDLRLLDRASRGLWSNVRFVCSARTGEPPYRAIKLLRRLRHAAVVANPSREAT
ncbi:MAG: glycosyltransferase family 2 protein [Paraburkholderia sp.]|uniref:glycosyltransferase family 2 protein n=1 Tax=Paraburkholderia sp. TaxID=1926495 RepID=UPI001224F2A7|nr:glycosyltransferase family 2 protein [Paraburkholderia sp.]TAL98918.1 MAG: glycosyltransferase family 2 protein [Paraburkholderia sp.]